MIIESSCCPPLILDFLEFVLSFSFPVFPTFHFNIKDVFKYLKVNLGWIRTGNVPNLRRSVTTNGDSTLLLMSKIWLSINALSSFQKISFWWTTNWWWFHKAFLCNRVLFFFRDMLLFNYLLIIYCSSCGIHYSWILEVELLLSFLLNVSRYLFSVKESAFSY